MPFSYLASAGSVQLFVDLHDKVNRIKLRLFLYLLQVSQAKRASWGRWHREVHSGG